MKSAFCFKNDTKFRDSLIGEGAGFADTRVSGPERKGFASLAHTAYAYNIGGGDDIFCS